MLIRFAPALFVLMWSTGFIGTKMGASGAEPFTFLSIRFVLVIALLVVIAWWMGSPGLTGEQRRHAIIVGVLVHATYLGGVMWAMRAGMASNVSALIVSLQPVLTAVAAGLLLGEMITRRHWAGVVLGLVGTGLVVAPKLAMAGSGTTLPLPTSLATLASATLALFGITLGTIYQKRFAGGIDLVSGAIWQYAGALLVIAPLAFALETRVVEWTPGVVGALVWLVVVLSIGAMSLLMMLIRENAVSRTSALFYLVPGMTAVMAYFMFGEQLSYVQLLGLVVVSAAVVLMQSTGKADAVGPGT
jgi:drug/metabolite transporter (DMT)-like permease